MADADHFRFFDLPKELRNNVYARWYEENRELPYDLVPELSHPYSEGKHPICAPFRIARHALPASRLVSRLFKREYEDEVFRDIALVHHVTHWRGQDGRAFAAYRLKETWLTLRYSKNIREVIVAVRDHPGNGYSMPPTITLVKRRKAENYWQCLPQWSLP